MFLFCFLFYVTKVPLNGENDMRPNFAESVPTSTPTPTTDYSHEGEITKSGVISIVTVVVVGLLIVFVGVACFHKKTPPIHANEDPLIK